MVHEKEIKTLKYMKWTKYTALLYFFFCIFSLVAIYSSRHPMFHNKQYFKWATTTLCLWAINPMVFIVSVMGLKAYFADRKNIENRNIIGQKWIGFFLWDISAILAWTISIIFFVYFTGGV